jgi:hypothetical protein
MNKDTGWNDPATLPELGRDRNDASVTTSRVMVGSHCDEQRQINNKSKKAVQIGHGRTSHGWQWSVRWPAHRWRLGRDRRRIDHNAGDSILLSPTPSFGRRWREGWNRWWRAEVPTSRRRENDRRPAAGSDITWVGESEGALGAIVSDGKAQDLGGNGNEV